MNPRRRALMRLQCGEAGRWMLGLVLPAGLSVLRFIIHYVLFKLLCEADLAIPIVEQYNYCLNR